MNLLLGTMERLPVLPSLAPGLSAVCIGVAVVVWPRPPDRGPGKGGRGPQLVDRGRPGGPRTGQPRLVWAARLVRPARVDRLARTSRRRRRHAESDAALLAEALAPCLAAGLPPTVALELAAGSVASEGLARRCALAAAEAAATGSSLGSALRRLATHANDPGLAHLARAWVLSEELGAPLADAVTSTAAAVRERQAAQRRLTAATAGARTSMAVLAALPVAGPLASALVGVSPARLYDSPLGATSALLGLALCGIGLWWARVIIRRASTPQAI